MRHPQAQSKEITGPFSRGPRARLLCSSLSATLGRYVAAGLMGSVINLTLMIGLVEAVGIAPWFAGGVALAVVVTLNFFFNRHAIFLSAAGRWQTQLWRYLAATAFFRGAEYLMFLLLVETIGLHYALGMLTALTLSNLSKFATYRRYVFRADAAD